MSRDTLLEVAIAGGLLIAVIAIQGLPGNKPPAPSAWQTPSLPSVATAPSSLAPPILQELAPGAHVIADLAPIRLTITLPDAWQRYNRFPSWLAYSRRDGIDRVIGFAILNPITDGRWTGCGNAETAASPGQSPVVIDGFAGVRVETAGVYGDPTCGAVNLLGVLEGPGPPGAPASLWVLDVHDVQLLMYVAAEGADPAPRVELRRLIESVRIEAA